MLGNFAGVAGFAAPKLFLIILAVVAGVLFLLVLGALALGSALALIALVSWLVRAPVRFKRRISPRPEPRRRNVGV